jgi:outer membrane lipoprotein SlyB
MKDMKVNRYTLGLAAATLGLVLTGCETPEGNPDRTATGALTGGAIGAVSGAVIGGEHAGEGALIGGAVGAVAGGLIGHTLDQEEQARLRAQAPQTYARVEQGQLLSLADIKALSKAGLSDDVIISEIRNTHTAYHLSAADIIDLHAAGVSQKVIAFMINTPGAVTPVSVAPASPPPPLLAETVVPAPYPGYVWISGEWTWSGRWVWVRGYWARPPYPGAVWVHGYWTRGPHGWARHPGHWR